MNTSAGPFHANPQPCLDHRYMPAAAGFYAQPQQQHPSPYHHPHHQPQHMAPHPGGFYPGANNRQTNIIPTGGPPMMNAQYTNAFLMNCYQGAVAANGWAGVPLISTAKRRSPRNKAPATCKAAIDVKDFGHGGTAPSSMSKMALHAQGPPIILNSSNGGGGNCQGPRHSRMQPSSHYRNKPNQNAHRVHHHQQQQHQFNGGQHRLLSADDNHNNNSAAGHCQRSLKFVAAAADENSSLLSNSSSSSGSVSPGGSSSSGTGALVADACLPRIIKPRKRRKKERKPGHNGSDAEQQSGGHSSSSLAQQKGADGNEEDFEDEEAVVSDFATACSCRLCDPHSHIWSFPLRRNGGCSLENGDHDDSGDLFPDAPQPPHSSVGHNGNDLYRANTTAAMTGKSQKVHPQPRSKDVGVIGGNRMNQQRNEWRGSPPQSAVAALAMGDNASLDTATIGGELLLGSAMWPSSACERSLSDEDSGFDDLLLHLHRNSMDYSGHAASEDEELLIENLANLLNSSSESKSADSPKQSETGRSDSSGVSSGSDSGSVFGECYSPLVNLGSPPSLAFSFPIAGSTAEGLFGHAAAVDNGLVGGGRVRLLDEEEEEMQKQQHVLNCLDMDWYRAATTNRRLLMPYSNN